MSRDGRGHPHDDDGFPRVSGDEPAPEAPEAPAEEVFPA